MTPSPAICRELQMLSSAFEHAVSEYNRLTSARVLAVRNGEDPFSFWEEIRKAGIQKDMAKLAIVKHQREHGC